MPWFLSLPLSALIIVISAFFVIIEFALLAARSSRLEEEVESSGSARAALRAQNQLTMMLAAAQLGITGATFALGAVAKPAVQQLLGPVLEAIGLPAAASYAVSFGIALFIVTFLHLVVGEMAPKSWAIAHPETAAKLVSPMGNTIVTVLRPLLSWINHMANRLVSLAGEEPVDRAVARGYDADMLATLVQHSAAQGVLDETSGDQLRTLISLHQTSVGDIIAPRTVRPTAVAPDATVSDVQEAARRSGHFRILLEPPPLDGPSTADGPGTADGPSTVDGHREVRMVHVRDTLLADPATPAADLAIQTLQLRESTTIMEAVEQMRTQRRLLAVVVPDDGPARIRGVVTSEDLLERIWPSVEQRLAAERKAG